MRTSDAGAVRPAAPELPLDELEEAEADAAEAAEASEEEADAATPDADEAIEPTAELALAPDADAEAEDSALKDVKAALADEARDESAVAPVKTGAVAVIVLAPAAVLAVTLGVAVAAPDEVSTCEGDVSKHAHARKSVNEPSTNQYQRRVVRMQPRILQEYVSMLNKPTDNERLASKKVLCGGLGSSSLSHDTVSALHDFSDDICAAACRCSGTVLQAYQ